MDDFDDMHISNMPPADSKIRQFYDKISEMPVKSWVPLEDKYYRLTQMGLMTFTETGKFNEVPNLSYFNYAQAKNGGPIGKFALHLTLNLSTLDKRKLRLNWSKDSIQPCFPLLCQR